MAQNFGYIWNNESNAAWFSYQDALEWRQCWYDDSLSLSHKYQFAIDNQLAGVGIWALGYDNGYDDLWGALYDNFIYSLEGDINIDGIINVIDIIIIVNMILGLSEPDYSVADMNQDGMINVLDIVLVVNEILDS